VKCVAISFFALLALTAFAAAFIPSLDLAVSGFFYKPDAGFFLADHPVFVALHWLAVKGAWALGGVFGVLALVSFLRRKPIGGSAAKGWLFLFLALLIGPVLIANVGLKDHWGRARPREVTEFGGAAHFSQALILQPVAHSNGSFVSGDGAFGFFLPSFAYLAPLPARRRTSRRLFWGGTAVGCAFGLARIAMGAHFLSDVLFAALLMLAASAVLHLAMFGRCTTQACWQNWLGFGD